MMHFVFILHELYAQWGWLRTSLLQLANATQKVPVYPQSYKTRKYTVWGEKVRVYKRYSSGIYHGALRGQKRKQKNNFDSIHSTDSRVRFPMESLEFFTHINLPVARWPWDGLSL